MTDLLTAAQMRAIEQAAIDSGDVTGLELMERAGRGVVKAVFDEWPELRNSSHRAAILCGPGNNGGDGFVVARLLKEQDWDVELFLFGDPAKLPPDARANWQRWIELGEVRPYVDATFCLEPSKWGPNDLIIDALFGTGLARPVTGFNAFGRTTRVSGTSPSDKPAGGEAYPNAHVVAVDLPSGLCSDTGRYLEVSAPETRQEFIKAHLTVTFHRPKCGHAMGDGPDACGKVVVADIGLGPWDDARHSA